MQSIFETLIASFLENNVGVANGFLNPELVAKLTQNLLKLEMNDQLKSAGTSNSKLASYDTAVRGDSIYWLDKSHNNIYENKFIALVENFIRYLNSCFAGITDCEFHYALYKKGSYYIKHLDQFRNNSGRQYSMISYLDNNWKAEDGGELLIHQGNNNQTISPTQGKTVFFKSNEIYHEVLATNISRMSITGWLKC